MLTRRWRDGRVTVQAKPTNALERAEHGTAACEKAGCRCGPCKAARARANRRRRAANNALWGRPVRYQCSTAPIQRHVADLVAAGWTLAAIARAAGLSVTSFHRALRRGTTMNTTVAKVLGVA
jgi:hypothetical protein